MRLHNPIIALCAIFALANIGIATYSAAAPMPLATVTIASASDDVPTPPPTPTSEIPLPTPPNTRCSAELITTTSVSIPTGTQVPATMKEVGRFNLSYVVPPTGCVTQPTDVAVIREVSVAFQWSDLFAAARRRAMVTTLELRSADRSILYGRVSSVRASGNTVVRFPTRTMRLAIPIGSVSEFVILGNTTNVTGGNAGIVNLTTRVTNVVAEISMSGDTMIGTLSYDGSPIAQPTAMTTGLDAASPSGTQNPGIGKEILRFWVTAINGEARMETLKLRLQTKQGEQTIPVPIHNVSISLQPEGFPKIGPVSVARDGTAIFVIPRSSEGSAIAAGQTKIVRVFADTNDLAIEQSLRATLFALTARSTTEGTIIRPVATMPVEGNWLSY